MHLAHRWRRDGLRVETGGAGRSLKSQMRLADRVGARYVCIVGEDELAARALSVRDMTAKRDFPRALDIGASASGVRAALAHLAHSPTEQRA